MTVTVPRLRRTLTHHHHTLANGLGIVATPQMHLGQAHVALHVRAGSRYETPATNGLSHFLEHMLYRGTRSLPSAHAVNDAFERVGGYLYAATQADMGVLSCSAPPESMPEVLRLFGEVVSAPRFTSIEVEKGIVEEEILEDLDDEGRMVDADNLARRMVYGDHPLGYSITGGIEQVQSFEMADLRRHHALHYTARNAVLAFSGAIEVDQAFALATEHLGVLPSGARIEVEAPVHAQGGPRLELVENASSQTELRVSFLAIAENDPRRAALEVGLRALDDGMSTRLYHRICDEQGLAYDTGALFDGFEDDGVLEFSASVQHDRAAKVTAEMLRLLRQFADEGLTDAELDKARRRMVWDTQAFADAPDELAEYTATTSLFRRFRSLEERLERNLAVTADDVRALFQALIRPERLNVLAVGLPSERESARLRKLVDGFR